MESQENARTLSEMKMDGMSVFLTYPQCPETKESLLDFLHTRGTISKCVIARELHEDGNPHLHAYVNFENRIKRVVTRYFDFNEYHPNIDTKIRSVNAVRKYIEKDGDFIDINMDAKEKWEKERTHKKVIGQRLLSGEKLHEVVKDVPDLIFDYGTLQRNLDLYRTDVSRDKPKCLEYIPNPWDIAMPIIEGKQKHYWVWSDKPNLGKTTKFLQPIATQFNCTWYNYEEKFQDVYSDSQFLLMDEYSSAHLKVTQLNQMCDGTYLYPRKGGAPTCGKFTLLICGNKHPNEIYPNTYQYISARFNVIELKEPKVAFTDNYPMMMSPPVKRKTNLLDLLKL